MEKTIIKHNGQMKTGEKIPLAPYKAKNYDHLIGIDGFSDKLLTTHFKLYEGYVTNTNTALEKISSLGKSGKTSTFELGEVKRRLGWEFNGMRLHEYYFGNLGGKEPVTSQKQFSDLINAQFGSFEAWQKDFLLTGAMRGIGWVVLYRDAHVNRLFNVWIEQHHGNHFSGTQPILVLDVFEHAYMNDYGTDKEKYMAAFFKNIDWSVVAGRCK